MSPPPSPYRDRNGLYRRCCACGAFKNHDQPGRWDLLPAPPEGAQGAVSHGLCEPCFDRDHGDSAPASALYPAVAARR